MFKEDYQETFFQEKKFGNQHSNKEEVAEKIDNNNENVGVKTRNVLTEEDKIASVSFKEITDVSVTASNGLEGLRLLDISSFLQGLLTLFHCPQFREVGTILITEDPLKRKGLTSFIQVECTNCDFEYSSYTLRMLAITIRHLR